MAADPSAPAPPMVRLGDTWPVSAEPHPVTGWQAPLAGVTTASGRPIRISAWGDAVPGGYNGGFAALDPASKEILGTIEYQSATGIDTVQIAMIEIAPAYRGQGISDTLLMRLVHEFPNQRIEPGYRTESGKRWWARVRHAVSHAGSEREA